MSEFEPQFETAAMEKAEHWLDEATSALEGIYEFPIIEPTDHRFLVQMERGILLSDKRAEILATMLDRRESFYIKTGEDIILEQFYILKLLFEKPS